MALDQVLERQAPQEMPEREQHDGFGLQDAIREEAQWQVKSALTELADDIVPKMRDAWMSSLGIDPQAIITNLLALPGDVQAKQHEISNIRESLRQTQEALAAAEAPLRWAATENGKNESQRALAFDDAARADERVQALRAAKADAETELRNHEADRDMLAEKSKNCRAVARLLAAMLTGDAGND